MFKSLPIYHISKLVASSLPFAHFSDGWLPDAIRDLTNNDPAARTLPFYRIRKPCMKTSEPREVGVKKPLVVRDRYLIVLRKRVGTWKACDAV